MLTPKAALAVALLGCSVPVLAGGEPPAPADLVLRRGAIYTMDAARSWAEAVAIAGGRVVAVGTNRDIEAHVGPRTRVLDLDGQMVLPGFHDAHVHPMGGIADRDCRLEGCTTPDEVREVLRRYVAAHDDAPWILGVGWALPVFPDGAPHRALLDEIIPDRPAYLVAGDGHSAWVNSKALAVAGIGRDTPDPPGGHIERDRETGDPTGTLREDAMGLVARHLPRRTPEEQVEGLARGLAMASRFGITAIQEAGADTETLEAYEALERAGRLPVRVVAAHRVRAGPAEAEIPRLRALRARCPGPRLRADAVKIFADGVLETRTAALLAPYAGSDDRGRANWEPECLNRFVAALDREGFQVHVHAIGDRAIRMALDAFEAARAANGVRDSRHHLAHLQVIDPADIPRFRRLGVVANFQPLWAQADPYITDLAEPLLGPERSRWLYPIASVERSGAVVVFGSDWPVSSMNPLENLSVAIRRRGCTAGPGPSWIPEECVALADALAAYTVRGAYLSFREHEAGSIEIGKAADLVVLDRNLFEVAPYEIPRVKVRMTLLEGRAVYREPGFGGATE